MVKNLSAMRETHVWSLGWEDSLKKRIATHSSILAWRIPWTEEPGRLQFMGSQRVGHDWVTNTFTFTVINTVWYWWKKRQIHQWDGIGSQKKGHINIVKWHLTKQKRQCDSGKLFFSTNGAEKNEHLYAKKGKKSKHRPYTLHKI